MARNGASRGDDRHLAYDDRVNSTLRRQRAIVTIGFALVAAGWLAYTTTIWSTSPRNQTGADMILGLGTITGYGVLAAAGWAWFKWIERSSASLPDMTVLLRLFAIGNLFFAIGFMAMAYDMTDWAFSLPFAGKTEIAQLAWYILQFIGFLLVSVAYWSASSQLRRIRSDAGRPEPEAAQARTL
jgi:hypothetical protein